jgi:hypothetical protein
MKKLLTLTLLISSLGFVGSAKAATEVKSAAALNNSPQIRVRIGQRRYRERHRRDWNQAYGDRVGYGRTFTRNVRYGRSIYRETYQVRDGRTFLISRVRLY